MNAQNLVPYLAEFDLTLSDLAPHQVAMFVAARNAAHYVRGLDVSVGTHPRDTAGAALAERQSDRVLDLTSYDIDPLQSELPADEMDVSVIHGVEDLSRIFPVQWLLEEIDPELFWVKLAQRELLMPEWQRPGERPRDSADETPQRELVEEPVVAQSVKQHAYVLLDTSSTMQDRDRRGTIARGLALEFLRAGHQQRAQLNLRPFAAVVGPLASGISREEFLAIARRIIDLPNCGQTRIQAALEQAVLDIRSAGPCLGASILLITDGISRLSSNPLVEETLHTFILGDLFEEKGKTGTIETLKAWSRTFHRIWGNRFAGILAPTWPDCQAAAGLLQAALEDRNSEAGALARLLENVQYLVREFRRSLGKDAPAPPELAPLENRLARVETMLQVTRARRPANEFRDVSAPHDRGASPSVAAGTAAPRRRSWMPSLGWSAGRQGEGPSSWAFALLAHLKHLALRIWTWARNCSRALFRRDP